jgi:hypothetical protein
MGATVSVRACLRTCTGDLDCRWNAYDTFWASCGHYQCLTPIGAPSGTRVCGDERQYEYDRAQVLMGRDLRPVRL